MSNIITLPRLVFLSILMGFSFHSILLGQSLPPKDSGQFSAEAQSGSQSEYDEVYQAGLAAGGCKAFCHRLQTLAPVFWCDGGALYGGCSCPKGSGIFILWREWSHIWTFVDCSEFYEGSAFNFNNYSYCYQFPGFNDWSSGHCPEEMHWSCNFNNCIQSSPILIDVEGNGFALTSAEDGVLFNFSRDGLDRMGWTVEASDDAFLVLDRNANGIIDDGLELFGNVTPQLSSSAPNGFIALAEYDKAPNGGNNDGVIDLHDAIFASLRLWQDKNHNGISEANELNTLQSLGIATMELSYKESKKTDQYGNKFKDRAKVKDIHGATAGRWAWDVFFRGGPAALEGAGAAAYSTENRDMLFAMLGRQGPSKVCR